MTKQIKMVLLVMVVPFLLILAGLLVFNQYMHPSPEWVFSRMERRASEAAQSILDCCGEKQVNIAEAAGEISLDDTYFYTLNSDARGNQEELMAMPRSVADEISGLEREFPACQGTLLLKAGQIGVLLTDDGSGCSYLCYPGGAYLARSAPAGEEDVRCLAMAGGWEIQMYYELKG